MTLSSALSRLKNWFRSRGSMGKRSRTGWQTDRFTFPDDSDEGDDGDDERTRRQTFEKHRHVDWCHDTPRPSVQTSYIDVPTIPFKRSRSVSLPSLATVSPTDYDADDRSSFHSFASDSSDLSYLLDRLESLDDDPVPRKRTAGDRPILQWISEIPGYLDELLRLEGRGDFADHPCNKCGLVTDQVYRCIDCQDLALYCRRCVIDAHSRHPIHRIAHWKDCHFTRVTLKSLGLQLQLGHGIGEKCLNPIPAPANDFTLLDVTGIHELAVNFCGCESARSHHIQVLRARWFPATSVNPKTAATFLMLENFQLLSLQSKVSGWEYYQTLARRADNTGVAPPKDRYMAFMAMTRQWRHLKSLKRAGRGHAPFGMAESHEGSCAVECPACPHPGKNIPKDWNNAPPDKKWVYRLFIAIDANFRLKRKMVSSDLADPSLNQGSAYMVEESAYKAHLKKFDTHTPESTNHCNNHEALKLATLKGSSGLAATGVVSVDCARHDMKRPCSTGDLQKGERFVNIDYVLNSSLQHHSTNDITASFDVACNYDRRLSPRFSSYGYDISAYHIVWAVPKFHINAHREQCRSDYNLLYLPFSARSDGEGIERGWGKSNPAASSTKEMGPGSRRDALDDIFGDHNWSKVSRLASSLLGKIKKAVPERNAQVSAFEELNAALPKDVTAAWRRAVELWETNPSSPNPFLLKRPSITQASIRRELAEEDQRALEGVVSDDSPGNKCSASAMIVAGLELEDLQTRIKADSESLSVHATDLQRARSLERENALKRRIDSWFQIQRTHMPDVVSYRNRLSADLPDHRAYNLPLLLPSFALSVFTVSPELADIEWRLRLGQAFDALNDLRTHLELRSHLYKFKDRFTRGQRANTRAQTVIKSVDSKIDVDAERYRIAYTALLALRPHAKKADLFAQLRPLEKSDIRHVADNADGQSDGRRSVSWIWQAPASVSRTDNVQLSDSLQESLRLEWCKARARANRWSEEVILLLEEMRRVIAYHEWAENKWTSFVNRRFPDQADYREGVDAYARRQAHVRRSMREYCANAWSDVPLWVCLGAVDEDDDLPAVETR
ncbi:hypothetical protein PYCCODRAFT_1472340 [Trametes coccinea BRFM310]|uniref:CxC2-like cysteine cluster KDZ transposase-associated domain-containing protein n=1 Tax=Trametes coccinea (strain BRFM310) TaxID=1353009 RepID=A0A1Y2IA34_TRAC3|nr:hypothetical protein PYCCODRAFT_1472340 [Trametes coccinea BRFM310]